MAWLRNYTRLVKFEHTLFALPFAMIGFFMAVTQPGADLSWRLFLLVVLCMVFARNAAMGFNRWLDRAFDQVNPRTAGREIPAGVISPASALVFVLINSLLFILTTWFINRLCFYLSPVALFVILFYSFTKRFTSLSHFFLSLGLAIAPLGAYLAVSGRFDWPPLILSAIVFFWVSGFDIIYSLQDEEFDLEQKLRSLPARLGKRRALRLSEAIHGITALLVMLFAMAVKGGGLHWAGVLLFTGMLLSQHLLVQSDDLRKVNLAFFTTNGIASVAYSLFLIGDMLLR